MNGGERPWRTERAGEGSGRAGGRAGRAAELCNIYQISQASHKICVCKFNEGQHDSNLPKRAPIKIIHALPLKDIRDEQKGIYDRPSPGPLPASPPSVRWLWWCCRGVESSTEVNANQMRETNNARRLRRALENIREWKILFSCALDD